MTHLTTDARAGYFSCVLPLPSGDFLELYASLEGPAVRVAYDDGRRIGAVEPDRHTLVLLYQALGDMLDWIADREGVADVPPARPGRPRRAIAGRGRPKHRAVLQGIDSEASR